MVIVSAVRTPIGSFRSTLADVPATRLGSIAIKEAVNKAGIMQHKVFVAFFKNLFSCFSRTLITINIIHVHANTVFFGL